jgi:hypothetical protein
MPKAIQKPSLSLHKCHEPGLLPLALLRRQAPSPRRDFSFPTGETESNRRHKWLTRSTLYFVFGAFTVIADLGTDCTGCLASFLYFLFPALRLQTFSVSEVPSTVKRIAMEISLLCPCAVIPIPLKCQAHLATTDLKLVLEVCGASPCLEGALDDVPPSDAVNTLPSDRGESGPRRTKYSVIDLVSLRSAGEAT